MERVKTLYLTGPISNDPDFREHFKQASFKLEVMHYLVLNPVTLGESAESHNWTRAMKKAIRMMMDADALACLDGWEGSRGSKIEMDLAHKLDMTIRTVDEWSKIGAYDGSQSDTVQ